MLGCGLSFQLLNGVALVNESRGEAPYGRPASTDMVCADLPDEDVKN